MLGKFKDLKKLSDNSHSPFSKFKVSSISVFKDGSEFRGVNLESASFPVTICAEKSSISAAISSGKKLVDLREVHVYGRTLKKEVEIFPCGSCRQLISEARHNVDVYIYKKTGEYKVHKIKDLIPYSFLGW